MSSPRAAAWRCVVAMAVILAAVEFYIACGNLVRSIMGAR